MLPFPGFPWLSQPLNLNLRPPLALSVTKQTVDATMSIKHMFVCSNMFSFCSISVLVRLEVYEVCTQLCRLN